MWGKSNGNLMLALIWDIDIETIIEQFMEHYATIVLPYKTKLINIKYTRKLIISETVPQPDIFEK